MGVVVAVLACFFAAYAFTKLLTSRLALDWFPFGVSIFFLFVLFLVNPLLGLLKQSFRLNRNELFLVFIIISCAVPMSGLGFAATFLAQLTAPLYHCPYQKLYPRQIMMLGWITPPREQSEKRVGIDGEPELRPCLNI